MKIVIDIREEDYKAIAKSYLPYGAIADVIRNGTPLPEHHGRLIDADDLLNTNIDTFSQQTELKIKFAPTIIEGSDSE